MKGYFITVFILLVSKTRKLDAVIDSFLLTYYDLKQVALVLYKKIILLCRFYTIKVICT